jgi:hypothetical protein
LNVSSEIAARGKARTFFNLGIQKQFKQKFINLFLGPELHFNDLEKGEWIMIDGFHAGII